VEASFFKLTAQTKNNKMISLKESLHEVLKELEKPARAKGEISGLSTGFKALDQRLLGLQPGQLIIMAARPAMGKTALALNWALVTAKQTQLPVAVFSYEMLHAEFAMRLLAVEYSVDARKFRSNDFNNLYLRKIADASIRLSNLSLHI